MDSILVNLQFILTSYELSFSLFGSATLGIMSFVIALAFAGEFRARCRMMKYFLTTCSVSFTSAFFIILLNPYLFYEVTSYFIVSKNLIFIAMWICMAELIHFITLRKSHSSQVNTSSSGSDKITIL